MSEPDHQQTQGERFAIEIDAPPSVRALLTKHLGIMAFLALPDLDEAELQKLLDQLPDQATQLLATQGFFAPQIQVLRQAHESLPLGLLTVNVQPGSLSHVTQVLHTFSVPSNQPCTDICQQLQQQVQNLWRLPVGQSFSQTKWAQAKQHGLSLLTQAHYPAAQLAHSEAVVSADTQTIDVTLEWHMGSAIALGALQIDGLHRYEAAWVEQLVKQSGAAAGQPYNAAALQLAQQRLAQSGYFESVYVSATPNTDTRMAPVQVQVREAPLGKLILGVGASTDHGTRLSAEHTWRRMPYLDWVALSQVKLERDTRSAQTEFIDPVVTQWGQWSTQLMSNRQLDQGVATTNQQWRCGVRQQQVQNERKFFAQYDRSHRHDPATATSAEASLSLNTSWSAFGFDTLPLPSSGQGWQHNLGLGWTLQQQQRPYVRAHSRWHALWPIGTTATQSRLSTRVEGGAIWSQPHVPVPDSQQFLAGGDQSIRGYGFRDMGREGSSGTVTPGKMMWTASLEWQRPLGSDLASQPYNTPQWEHAVFIDAGSVADKLNALTPRWGIGTGVRYHSPLGPMQLDLAYGQSTRRWRLHFGVGFAF